MKIQVTIPVATRSQSFIPGTEYDIDAAEAELWILAGHAVAVDANYKPASSSKPEPVKLDQKPIQPVEQVAVMKLVEPVAPTTNAAPTAEADQPTAVDLAKKASRTAKP